MAINTEKYTQNPFIKGEDLDEDERLVLTIKAAYETKFPSGDEVPVLEFLEDERKLTLNKTRVRKMVEMFGPDSDEWLDRRIALLPVPVQFNGKSQMGVAITAPPKRKKAATESTKAEVKFMADDDDEDENPF